MNKRVRRFLLQVFSSLNALFLTFQPLAVLPALVMNPAVVRAEAPVSFDAVDLSFNISNHTFELRVTTNQVLPFQITYEDENQVPPPPVIQAISGNVSESTPGIFVASEYAGTCTANGQCIPHTFTRGRLTVGSSYGRSFRLINNQIVFDGAFQCGSSIFSVNNTAQMHWFDGSTNMIQFAYPLSFASSASADDPQNPRTYYIERYGDRLAYFDHSMSSHVIVGSTGIGASPVTKMAFSTSGVLYALTDSHHLYSINTSTAFASDLGMVTGIGTGGDIAFDETDVLYLIDTTGNLHSLNVGTLTTTLVVSTGLTPVTGLAYQRSTGKLFISRSISNGTQSTLHSVNRDGSDLQQVSLVNQPQVNDLSSCVTQAQTLPQPGSITIMKDVVPNDASVWDFTISPPGNMALGYMDMPDGGSHTFSNLVSGSYTISESTAPEYTTSIVCSNNMTASSNQVSFVLAEGEDVSCTYTNTFIGRCGDGLVMGQEQCDYGSLNGQSNCSSQCTWVTECRAEMVANGGFETPVVTQGAKWDAFDNAEVPGWSAAWYGGSPSYSGHDRPEPQIELHRGVLGAAAEAQQYAELDTDWTGPVNEFNNEPASIALSQDIPTIIGNQYTVSWSYSPRPNYANNHLSVSLDGTEQWNSGVVAGGGSVNWQTQSFTFTATGSVARITFTEVGPADSLGMFLDDVKVSCTEPTPTPSPTATPTPSPTPIACEAGPTWANNVVSSDQGTLNNGNPVTDPSRTNPLKSLGVNDNQFYSLGYGGTIIVSFAGYIVDVPNSPDLSFHEVTNGSRSGYGVESANVDVSQDGQNWIILDEVDNQGAGVDYLDFSSTGLPWIKYVRLTDTTSDPKMPATADGYDLDAVDATQQVCEEPMPPVTVVAQKVICNTEADLPNWSGSGTAITATTAQEYVASHSNTCHLADVWDFQWAPAGAGTFDDFQTNGTSLGSPWTTFSAVGGIATTSIPSTTQLGGRIETREILSSEYVPFSNGSNISAEFYCTGDVANYDNWEWINNPQPGQTYYCVGFNAIKSNDVTVCKEDSSGSPLSGWKVGLSQPTGFDQMIPVTNGDGVTTSLSSGAYVVYTSGTYRYGTEAMIADAGYSFRPVGIPNGTGGWVNGDDLLSYPGALELKLSGGNITDTNINWGGFNSEHQYSAYLTEFEGDLNLAVWDNYYGDNLNNGAFRAKIDKSYVSGMTNQNGCVTFQDVPYGSYQVFEVGDKNWSFVSTTVDDEVITSYPATATVDDQVPVITLTNKFVGGGTIRIVKDVIPDDNQTKFDYTLSNSEGYSVSDQVWEGNPSGYVHLPEAEYTLSEVDLPNYVESISCSDGQVSKFNSITFDLNTGDDITCTITNSQYGSFSGKKYIDVYGNGQFDPDDSVVEGWKIMLYLHDGTDYQYLTEKTTDGLGNYTFNNLLPGMYRIEEDLSSGDYIATDPNEFGLYNAVNLNAGENLTGFDFGNYQPGTIEGTKYFDADQNGQFDDGESVMQYWGISLSGPDVDQQVVTDENGAFSFANLKAGTYTLCEEDRTDWGWEVTEPAEPINKVCREVVIDRSGETEVANFGNFIDSRLYIMKTNDAWPTDVTIGDEVTYTIRVMAMGGPVYDATVFDVPPAQLTYVPESFTADSSNGTDLVADGTTGDPNYQSPGKWTLGDLAKDEIVTLTYKAKVGTLADPGVYPDMVWATGTSEQSRATEGDTDDLLALSDPEVQANDEGVVFDGSQGHFGEDNFAGTQVAIVLDQTPFSEYQVGRTEEKQGAVLGASTELPATGARAWLTLLALVSMVAGAGLLLFNRRSHKSGLKVVIGLLVIGFSLWFAQPAQALTSVRVEEPYNNSAEFSLDAITNQTSLKVDFVVLNTDNLSVTAQCQQQKNDGVWSNITTNYTVKAGGNSGYCEAKDLENTQNYDFRVVVSGDGPDKISDEVRVGLETTRPDKPVNYGKTQGNYCEDKISFKTANDGQTTSVEVYRSTDNDHFTAKPDTRVITIPIGPNQEYTLTTSKPNCDDTYYYVIRAFDVNGNASDLVGDLEIKTVIIESASGTTQTVQLGAIPAGSAFIGGDTTGGSTTGEATEDAAVATEATTDETSTEPNVTESTDGSVLGSATETFMSFLTRFGLPIGVGLIVLAGLYIIFFGKRNEK